MSSLEPWRNIVLACVVIAPLLSLVPSVAPAFVLFLVSVLTFVVLTQAWNIMTGYCGYFFLGGATFYGIGAYIMALSPYLPYHLNILLAGSISAACAFALGIPFLRIRGPYFAIATFTSGELVKNVVYYLEHELARTTGRYLASQEISLVYYTILGIAIAATLVSYGVRNSKFGLGLFSIKENEDAAESTGVNTTLYKLYAFSLCAFFTGATGAAVVARFGYIDAWVAFDSTYSMYPVVMGFFGGAGTVMGPILGAAILRSIFEVFFGGRDPYPFGIALGVLIIVSRMLLPLGLTGIKSSLSRFSKRTALARS